MLFHKICCLSIVVLTVKNGFSVFSDIQPQLSLYRIFSGTEMYCSLLPARRSLIRWMVSATISRIIRCYCGRDSGSISRASGALSIPLIVSDPAEH